MRVGESNRVGETHNVTFFLKKKHQKMLHTQACEFLREKVGWLFVVVVCGALVTMCSWFSHKGRVPLFVNHLHTVDHSLEYNCACIHVSP
jgi:hypothetical protein